MLLVFAAGFLTMHGFFAVSEAADPHATQHAVVIDEPDPVAPAEHHDLVVGCVVALVGIGLTGLALLSLRRSPVIEKWQQAVAAVVPLITGPSAARWSPPRVALCVIRV